MEVSELSTVGHSTPRKEPQYPLNRKVGGPQIQWGRYGKEKIYTLTPCFIERLDSGKDYLCHQHRNNK